MPNIARQTQVERKTVGNAVQNGYDGFFAFFDGGDARLEFEDVAPQGVGFAGGVDGGLGGELALGCGLVGVSRYGEGRRGRGGLLGRRGLL